jgi:hypothetical protein
MVIYLALPVVEQVGSVALLQATALLSGVSCIEGWAYAALAAFMVESLAALRISKLANGSQLPLGMEPKIRPNAGRRRPGSKVSVQFKATDGSCRDHEPTSPSVSSR